MVLQTLSLPTMYSTDLYKGPGWLAVSRIRDVFLLEQSSFKREDSSIFYSTAATVGPGRASTLGKTPLAFPHFLLP